MRVLRSVFLWFAVVLLLAGSSVSASQKHIFDLGMKLKDLSPPCKIDFENLYSDKKVISAVQDIRHQIAKVTEGEKWSCIAPAQNCRNPWTMGHCCSFDGMAYWSNHTDVLENFKQLAGSITAGYVTYMSQQITLNQQNPICMTTMNQAFVQPFYAPSTCLNVDDAQAISQAASANCLKLNDIYGADTLECSLNW